VRAAEPLPSFMTAHEDRAHCTNSPPPPHGGGGLSHRAWRNSAHAQNRTQMHAPYRTKVCTPLRLAGVRTRTRTPRTRDDAPLVAHFRAAYHAAAGEIIRHSLDGKAAVLRSACLRGCARIEASVIARLRCTEMVWRRKIALGGQKRAVLTASRRISIAANRAP